MSANTVTIEELFAGKLEAHIAKIVAAWPPLTPEQRDRLSMLFRAGIITPAPERPEVTAIRKAEEALAKVRGDFSEAMDGCHGCGLSRKVHSYQERYTVGYHEFVSLSPDGAIKVAQLYKRKIAAADKALEEARS